MAIARITGTVRVSESGRNLAIWEEYEYTFKGDLVQAKRRWTVWFNSGFEGIADGDWLEVEGELTTKVSEWQKPDGTIKNVVEHSLNEPVIKRHVPKVTETTAEPKPRVIDEDDLRKYGAPF